MLTWNQQLSVNVIEIDAQHQDIFTRINRCFESLDHESDARSLEDLFGFLEQYIEKHFADEERYMEKYQPYHYPDDANHHAAHAAFRRDFEEFRTDLVKGDVSKLFITEFKSWMTNWWLLHINRTDKGLGEFIRKVILEMPF